MGRPSETPGHRNPPVEVESSTSSSYGLEGIREQLRERLGSSFSQVDEEKKVDTPFYQSLAPLVEKFKETKQKSNDYGKATEVQDATSRLNVEKSVLAEADEAGASPQLIPGLPDELALLCLARVPWKYQPKLTTVCKSWAAFLWSDYVYTIRTRQQTRHSLLLVLSVPFKLGPLKITVFDATTGAVDWDKPLLNVDHPSKWSGFLRGFRCAVVGPDLFIIGGRHDGVRSGTGGGVWRVNFIRRQWSLAAPLLAPRRDFACSVVDGNIYVAGGTLSDRILPGHGKSPVLQSAEYYKIDEDKWIRLPDLNVPRVGCLGGELGGCFYVIGGGSDHGTVNFECFRSAEVYNSTTNSWRVIENMWQSESILPRAVAGFNSSLFAVDSDEQMLKSYDADTNSWTDITSMPFASANVSAKRKGNRPSHYQAMGGVPGDQLVDLPNQGLLWIGPSGFSSHSLLPLQQGTVGADWTIEEDALGSSLASSLNRVDGTFEVDDVCRSSTSGFAIPQLKASHLIIGAASIKI